MTVEADIFTQLSGYSNLTSLVSTRIYYNTLPQNPTYPNVVFSRVTTQPSNTLGTRNNRTQARFQFDCRATSDKSADEVAIQVIAGMEAATTFKSLYIDKSAFPYEPGIQGHRVNVDMSVWFTE